MHICCIQQLSTALLHYANPLFKLLTIFLQKQITAYQKVVSHVWDIVNKAREEWEVESSQRGNTQQNSSVADTHLLVAAVGMGKGLKVILGLKLFLHNLI